MSAVTEILFRLFAWVRPLMWHYHRIGHVLEAALISLERPSGDHLASGMRSPARPRAPRLRREDEAAPFTFAAHHRPATTTIFPPDSDDDDFRNPDSDDDDDDFFVRRRNSRATPINPDCLLPDCLAHAPARTRLHFRTNLKPC